MLHQETAHQETAHAASAATEERPAACKGFMEHGDPLFMHGRGYHGPLEAPACIWRCEKPPRDEHDRPAWLTASEFADTEAVARAKVSQLAVLLQASRRTVLYTGAGISAAVVGQAARSGTNKQGWKGCPSAAKPTFTHHALGLLGRCGLVHSWQQQNHDGLPQKAGFPQHLINEVHGSWFDPSNPVVKYSGNLKDDAYAWMERDAREADLVIVIGTSLGGLNADQVATNTADRSLRTGAQRCLGSVCINLQQTPQDGKMALRLFGKSDDVLGQLLAKLGLNFDGLRGGASLRTAEKAGRATYWPRESRLLVPYDARGRRLQSFAAAPPPGAAAAEGRPSPKEHEGEEDWMWLDLGDDKEVRLEDGHNCLGAQQPVHKHITSGIGRVVARSDPSSCFHLEIQGAKMKLGLWWLEAARAGAVAQLPIVNRRPQFAPSPRLRRRASNEGGEGEGTDSPSGRKGKREGKAPLPLVPRAPVAKDTGKGVGAGASGRSGS